MADDSAKDDLSFDAKLTETLTNAYREATKEPAPETESSPETEATAEIKAEETEQQKADRLRDEKGRFAKAAEEAQKETVVEATKAEAAKIKPPSSWKTAMKEKFLTLDPEVQAEILRREEDSLKGLGQYSEKAKFADRVQHVISPYAAMLQSEGMTPEAVVQESLAMAYQLRHGTPQQKQQMFYQLAQNFGVDLKALTSDEAPQVDPNIAALQQQIQSLQQHIQSQQSQSQAALYTKAESEVQGFATPDRPYFDDVREDMARLINSGLANDLQDAYEQATWRNPTVRARLLAEQQAQAEAKRQEEAKKKAEEARRAAAVNVSSKPVPNPTDPLGSMEETMRAAYRRAAGQ